MSLLLWKFLNCDNKLKGFFFWWFIYIVLAALITHLSIYYQLIHLSVCIFAYSSLGNYLRILINLNEEPYRIRDTGDAESYR